MINAIYYHDVYLLFVTIVTLIICNVIWNGEKDLKKYKYLSLFVVIIVSLFIGLRPDDQVFGDSQAYIYIYNSLKLSKYYFYTGNNIIFVNLLLIFASLDIGLSLFFLFNSFVYFVCTYISLNIIFPQKYIIAYLIFLGSFSTYAYAVNGIRAGIAASIFYCAIALKDKKVITIILLLISWGFHHSMHVCILAFIIVYYYCKPKIYLYIWIICLFLAICHVTYFQNLFSKMTSEKGAGYLVYSSVIILKKMGQMRYDFVLYSSFPIIIGYYIYNKLKEKVEEFNFILCLYILLNSIWLLCMYANFTNRIAYLSWQLYPLLLGYPFLSEKIKINNFKSLHRKILVYVTLGHLGFTLFMHIVYYA